MNYFSKKSVSKDKEQALKEATKKLHKPIYIIYTSYEEDVEYFGNQLREKYKDCIVLGMVHVKEKQEQTRLIVNAFFDDVEILGGVMTSISKSPIRFAYEIERQIQQLNPGNSDTVCIAFMNVDYGFRAQTTLKAIMEDCDIPLIGGRIFHTQRFEKNKYQKMYYDGKMYGDNCVYLLIRNKHGKIKVYQESLFHKKDGKRFSVTKVKALEDGISEVYELDNKPVLEVISKELNMSIKTVEGQIFFFPFSKEIGTEEYLIGMWEVNKRHESIICEKCNLNDRITILERMDSRKKLKETIREIKKDIPKPSLIFSIECVSRYLLFQEENYLEEYRQKIEKLAPQMEVISSGEIYKGRFVTMTMTCAVFE